MRVSCSRCETHYSIPSEKLESGPIKVRCKKCGHVFGVRKKAPRPQAEEAVQPLAPFAAAPTPQEEKSTDEVSQDEAGAGETDSSTDDLFGEFGDSDGEEQQDEEKGGDLDLGGAFADDEDSQEEDDLDLSFNQEEESDDSREEDETGDGETAFGEAAFGGPIDFGTDDKDDSEEELGGDQEQQDEELDFDLSSFAASAFGDGEKDEEQAESGDDDEKREGIRDFDLGDFSASTPDEEEELGFDSDTGDDTDDYGDDEEELGDPFLQTDPFSDDTDADDADEDEGFLADEKKNGAVDEREDADSLFDRITDDFQPESMGGFGDDDEEEEEEEKEAGFSITSDDDEQDEEEDPDAPRLDLRRGSRGSEPPLEYPGVDRKEPKPVLKALIVALLMGTIAFVGYNLLVNPDAAFYLMKIPGINKLIDLETGHKSLKPVEPIKGAYFKRDGKRELYVISGWIMNKSSEAMSAVKIKGIIFDKSGDKVGESSSFLASVLTEPELTAMDDKQIKTKLAKGKLAVLSPGDKEVFMLVFTNPPAKVAKHKIEVASAAKAANEKDKK